MSTFLGDFLASSCLFVSLSVWSNSASPTGRIFTKFDILFIENRSTNSSIIKIRQE